MSFADCLNDAMDEGSADKVRGERAMEMWRELREKYRSNGYADDTADALAAEDVKAAFKREAGLARHSFLATAATIRKIDAEVAAQTPEGLATMATTKVEYSANRPGAGKSIVGQTNALRRLFHHRIADLAVEHGRNIAGNNRNKAGLKNVGRELFGEPTGDHAAASIASAVSDTFKEARRMFNEAGGAIGDLADWGLPHVHDALAITKTGFDRWASDLRENIAWHRIEDYRTGKPMAADGASPPRDVQDAFLKEIYDNLAFGKGSKEAQYGRQDGKNLIRQHAESRVLHFKNADGWIAYNKKYGSGDIYGSVVAHLHRMSEDIVLLREFGPSYEVGLDYQRQRAVQRAREMGDADLAEKINGNHEHATKMLRIQRGGARSSSRLQAQVARFFSSTRHVMTAALLDRAIIASLSDSNTMRLAAKSVGMQQGGPFVRHMDLITKGATREQLLRGGWIADTMLDPGLILSRWQSEVPPAAIAERISSGVMRAQGLAFWTDQARIAFQSEIAGLFADNAGRRIADIDDPLRGLLAKHGVSDDEWAAFTRADHMFTTDTGAVFASPMWWRQSTDLPDARADEIFLKMQSLIEEQTEFAVPTQSLWARAGIEGDMPPGSIGYEIAKSGLMVKSFAMTFTVNQYARIAAQRTGWDRAKYVLDLLAGATILGGVSLQIANMVSGRDPQDMTDPGWWAQAAAKGGGFGVAGDIIAAGQTSWGGGFQSYIAGPGIQLVGDTWNLSVGNAVELMSGSDTGFGRELVKYLDRWTPGADLPPIGLAMDRLFWDSLQKALDPDAERALQRAASRRENLYGNGTWWTPGSPLPGRAPDMAGAIGQ